MGLVIAFFRILALLVGTGATIIAAELFVGNILLAIVGVELLSSPVWNAVYSAITYIVTIIILVFLPNWFRKLITDEKRRTTKGEISAKKKIVKGESLEKAEGRQVVEDGDPKNTEIAERVTTSEDQEETEEKVATDKVLKKTEESKKTKKKLGVFARRKLRNDGKLLDVLGIRGWPTWADIGLAPIAYVAYLVLASGLLSVFMQLFPWFNAEEVQDVGFSLSIAGGEKILAFITLVVVAPIAEELIFRGWLYEKIKRELRGGVPKWAEITIATVLTSVLFGIVHLQWNVGVNVFALSVIMCLLREITGTTYAGILLHMLKNGVAFYVLFVLGAA